MLVGTVKKTVDRIFLSDSRDYVAFKHDHMSWLTNCKLITQQHLFLFHNTKVWIKLYLQYKKSILILHLWLRHLNYWFQKWLCLAKPWMVMLYIYQHPGSRLWVRTWTWTWNLIAVKVRARLSSLSDSHNQFWVRNESVFGFDILLQLHGFFRGDKTKSRWAKREKGCFKNCKYFFKYPEWFNLHE